MTRLAPWLLVMLLGAPCSVCAQATLVADLGGPLGFGDDVLARDDDATSASVDLRPAFPSGIDFFGTRYTALFVNTNGNVSFGGPLAAFTPDEFPQSSRPMIAAWWADVDTRTIIDGAPDRNLVYYATSPGRLVATWIDVGYYSHHVDLLNAFQIVLTAAPGEPDGTFDVELRYNRCEWTTGDATEGHMMGLGGIAAQAGFDGGDHVNYLTLPGSRTADVLRLCETSNVDGGGEVGVWRLHPRGSGVSATCGNGLRETGEACDDGNRTPHDGCNAACEVDTPCFTIFPDGGIGLPFDATLVFGPPDGDVMLPDANGADATGAFGLGETGLMDGSPGPGSIGRCPDEDGGVVSMDAGVRMDAGMRMDAGSTPFPDAGRFDAGPRIDAARPPNVLLVTGNGCACRVSSSRGAPFPIASTLVLLALVVGRGRRASRSFAAHRRV